MKARSLFLSFWSVCQVCSVASVKQMCAGYARTSANRGKSVSFYATKTENTYVLGDKSDQVPCYSY